MSLKRYYGITIGGILLTIFGVFLLKAIPNGENLLRTLPYLCIGIGCGAFGHGVGEILSKKAVAKDPKLAKQIEIDTKDERNVKLVNMAKAKGYDISIYIFGALLVTFAIMGASFSVIIPLVVAYLFVQFYTWYYRVKLEKQE
jgi:hypothetical protein